MKERYDFSRGKRGRITPKEPEPRGKTRITIRLDEYDYHGAAALGCVMLSISFLGLWAINFLQNWGRRRFTATGR